MRHINFFMPHLPKPNFQSPTVVVRITSCSELSSVKARSSLFDK